MSHLTKDQVKLVHRAKRIEGQAKGIRQLIEAEADCNKLLQAITACRGALNGLLAEALEGHIYHHVLDEDSALSKAQQQATDELLKVIRTYLK
jgi:FrmR/RcnR family transcriptional regulator, repressor of frmRAB operon